MVKYFLAIVVGLLLHGVSYSQKNDTIPPFIKGKEAVGIKVTDTGRIKPKDSTRYSRTHTTDSPYKVDSFARKKHNPRKATLFSAFCPGLGQVYNKKYWKLPIVYAAIGIPAYTYFDNKNWYNKCQYALSLVVNGDTTQASLDKVDPKLRVLVTTRQDNSIRSYRNQYRKNQDYSVLFVLLFWGLQIVDATVDAHLKDFDVSNELSMHLQPGGGSLNNATGLSLVFDLHKARSRAISLP